MRKKLLLTATFAGLFAMSAPAATISIDGALNQFTNDVSGIDDIWTGSLVDNSAYYFSVSNSSPISADDINPTTGLRWSALTNLTDEINSSQSNYESGMGGSDISANGAEAIADDRYFEISLAATSYIFNHDSISVDLWRNDDTAAQYYQFAIGETFLGDAFNASLSGSGNSYTYTYAGDDLPKNVPYSDLRLYMWGGTSGNGNTHYTKFTASYTQVPEPATYALVLGLAALGGLVMRRRRA